MSGQFTVPAKGLSGFQLDMLDTEGMESRDNAVYRVDVIPDKVPVVRLTYPDRKEELITRHATMLIAFDAVDDFEIARIRLKYKVDTVENGTEKVVELLHHSEGADSIVTWQELPQPRRLKDTLRDAVREHFGPVLQAGSAAQAIGALGRFRIICAVREGPYGTMTINRLVEEILLELELVSAEGIKFGNYPGKPIMVTVNNYVLKLFNGDTGVVWPERLGGRTLVHFPEETGSIRAVARERLADHETVYAMTVHKSQGSEFDHVLLVLPAKENPMLTRELIYTGLTRARKSVRLLSNEDVLRAAVRSRALRASGLRQALTLDS